MTQHLDSDFGSEVEPTNCQHHLINIAFNKNNNANKLLSLKKMHPKI